MLVDLIVKVNDLAVNLEHVGELVVDDLNQSHVVMPLLRSDL